MLCESLSKTSCKLLNVFIFSLNSIVVFIKMLVREFFFMYIVSEKSVLLTPVEH